MNRVSDDERGWVVITAILVMVLMIGLGIALLAIVDTQSSQSRQERERESSFNLTEGALYAQSVTLQNNWPTVAPSASGTSCDPSAPSKSCAYGRYTSVNPAVLSSGSPCVYTNGALTGSVNQCPTVQDLERTFNNVDAFQNGTWYLQVRDNRDSAGNISTTYDRDTVNATACKDSNNVNVVCTWDANGDRRLWVRATGIVRGKTRRMVALLQLEKQRVPFPSNVLTAQSVSVTNNGQDIVDGGGSQVALRCGFSDTTTSTAIVKNTKTLTINAPANGAVAANMGVYLDTGANQELMTVASVTGGTNITFTQNVGNNHPANVAFKLGPSGQGGPCTSWDAKKDQVSADQYLYGSSWPPAMSDDTFSAISLDPTVKHYTNGCPTGLNAAGWSGTVIVDNSGTGDPTLNSGACTINLQGSAAGTINGPLAGGNPTACTTYGMIIVQSGTLRLDGNQVFCGIIYMRNKGNINGPVFATGASAQVVGAVAVDGTGSVVVGSGCGSCGGSILYDPNAAGQVGVAGAAGLVQNTWRELSPAQ